MKNNYKPITSARTAEKVKSKIQNMPHPMIPPDNDGDEYPPSRIPKKKAKPVV